MPKSALLLQGYSKREFLSDAIAEMVVGFTNGIAAIIASMQIKDFFSLKFERRPASYKKNWPCRPARIDDVRM